MTETLDFERALTPQEIEERTALHLQLAKQVAANLADVAVRRKEIRTLNGQRRALDVQSAQVLREITTGTVLETRQGKLPLDVSGGEPFGARYPMCRDAQRLHAELAVVLQNQGGLVPSIEKLERWHPSTPEFQKIAHWSRTELAHMNAKEHPDIQLPPRLPMPHELVELRMYLARASKPRKERAGKPRAAKVRPSSGTPTARVGRGRR